MQKTLSNTQEAICLIHSPTNIQAKDIRPTHEFFEDQLKFLDRKHEEIKKLEEQKQAKEAASIKKKPEIDNKSKKIAKKLRDDKPAYERLYNKRTVSVDLGENEQKKSTKRSNPNNESVSVEHLFQDAKKREQRQKEEAEKIERERNKKIPCCPTTDTLLSNKFDKDFSDAISNTNEKEEITIEQMSI